ncbi:MarR family winged helix-turn-helix transcriptional regulator [Subtercola sp. YIM 133946]|uniref:MarR family winged helix-turn-helix transcriptional regulator n=1 Tax=Subtercola sp. YIM 133946 TaxID=3118909 RepID=UPI002F94685D
MDDIFTTLIDEIFQLNGALLAAGDRIAATSGLSAARWQVLGRVADAPASVASIARGRGLRRQSVQETVARLERAGLVVRSPNPADLRAPLVAITDAGEAALARIEPVRSAWAASTPSAIPRAELEAALKTLQRLQRLIE